MLNITDATSFARALDSPISDPIKALLRLRRDQLLDGSDHDIGDLAHFIIIEAGDTLPQIEVAAEYPVVTTGAFEWVADHGDVVEAVAVLNDEGFAVVLVCPNTSDVDADLLARLRDEVTCAEADRLAALKREQSERH